VDGVVDVLEVEVEVEGGFEPLLVPLLVVEVEVELEVEERLALDVLVVVEAELEVDAGEQDSLSWATVPVTPGRFWTGVPAGTL